jgi:DNA-binding protein H-NS
MKFKYEMVMKVSKKTEDELYLHKVEKEKMIRDLEELKAKYELF